MVDFGECQILVSLQLSACGKTTLKRIRSTKKCNKKKKCFLLTFYCCVVGSSLFGIEILIVKM